MKRAILIVLLLVTGAGATFAQGTEAGRIVKDAAVAAAKVLAGENPVTAAAKTLLSPQKTAEPELDEKPGWTKAATISRQCLRVSPASGRRRLRPAKATSENN